MVLGNVSMIIPIGGSSEDMAEHELVLCVFTQKEEGDPKGVEGV